MELACRGVYLLSIGLAKKVILADSFAQIADAGFGTQNNLSTLEAWSSSLAYTFQIYYDFSGYSDIAVGSAWLLGIDIPQNFNAPYRSKSISEFWQRWHISLSNFITNYLYTPILRSMGSATLRTSAVATLLAMGIAGLWHGPAWTFLVFGLLHGVGLSANQIWKKKKLKMPGWLGWLVTFLLVVIAFVFFRSPSVGSAIRMLSEMLPHSPLSGLGSLRGILPQNATILVRPVAIGTVPAFWFKSSAELSKSFRPTALTACTTAALLLLSLVYINSTAAKQFVYFAF
jgi:D-alanyl-lipoteichoic acid acyltransferase DltB (MBOAT superfamily)